MFLDHHGRLRYPLSRSFFYPASSDSHAPGRSAQQKLAADTRQDTIPCEIPLRTGKNITANIANFATFGL